MTRKLELRGVVREVTRSRTTDEDTARTLSFAWEEHGSAYNEDMTCAQRGTRGLRAVMTHSDFGESVALLSDDSDAEDVRDEVLTCMGDVLADMRHLLDSLPGDGAESWQEALRNCELHYSAERYEEDEANADR